MADVVDTVTTLGGRGIVAVLDAANDTLLFFLNSLKNSAFEKNASILTEYVKNNGTLLFYMPQDFAIEDIENKLKEHDVPFVEKLDKNTNKTLIAVRDCDRDVLHDLQTEIYAEQKRITRLSPSDFYRLNMNKSIYAVNDINRYQLRLIQNIAKRKDFVFTAISKENGLYQVYFSSKDAKSTDDGPSKLNSALTLLSLYSSGISGDYAKRVFDSDAKEIDTANQKLHSPTRNFYVCAATAKNDYAEFVHVDINSFTHCNGDTVIISELEKDNDNFEEDFSNVIYGMKNPVILTKEEFEKPIEERNAIIKEKYERRKATQTKFENDNMKIEKIASKAIHQAIEENEEPSLEEAFADCSAEQQTVAADFIRDYTNKKVLFAENMCEITDIDNTELVEYLEINDTLEIHGGEEEVEEHDR